MHVYFSGIGGTGIGPLALIAHKAGFTVSGSDKQDSDYIHYLQKQGINDIHIGQSREAIAAVHAAHPIDWLVFSSAVPKEQPGHPELQFCKEQGIKATKRDEFLSDFITQKNLKLIAIAGTHGKTTTTAMAIWLCKQLGLPVSYSVGAKLSFGAMGEFNPASDYFIYEADEYDRNFLAFYPYLSIITGIDWDHPDIYPSRESYNQAFIDFINQSDRVVMWEDDDQKLSVRDLKPTRIVLSKTDESSLRHLTLPGKVNRENALEVAAALDVLVPGTSKDELMQQLNAFPGLSRRFEEIIPGLYTDYAHTPPKIQGALQLAHEKGGDNVVIIYEGLHNTRQHFIKHELHTLFDGVKKLYIVPSYLAREDPNLALLSPNDLKALLSPTAQSHAEPAELNHELKQTIQNHIAAGDTVLCITAGGGNSLDEWLRREFAP